LIDELPWLSEQEPSIDGLLQTDLDDAVAAVKRAWEQAKRPAATPAVAQRPPLRRDEDATCEPRGLSWDRLLEKLMEPVGRDRDFLGSAAHR